MAAEMIEHMLVSSTVDAETRAEIEALKQFTLSPREYNRSFRVYRLTHMPQSATKIVASSSAISGHTELKSLPTEVTDPDQRWAELLSDTGSFDLLEQLAAEALAEEDAGLTLDLDDLLS